MTCLFHDRRKLLWFVCIFLLAAISVGAASHLAAQSVSKVNRIVVEKSKRTLTLMDGEKIVKTYKTALGGEPIGAKDRQGDHKTPEGIYSLDAKNPNSQFHKALHISYPNQADRAHARKLGVSPGAMRKFTDWVRSGDGLGQSTA